MHRSRAGAVGLRGLLGRSATGAGAVGPGRGAGLGPVFVQKLAEPEEDWNPVALAPQPSRIPCMLLAAVCE